jgi:hypothetical protein
MDYREDWFIYDNKLINDLPTKNGDFGISIVLGIAPEGSPPGSPIYIPEGGIGFRVNIYDRKAVKRTELFFASLDDITFFLNYYVSKCSNIVEINRAYAGFCMSEDAIINKGYTQ